jgi:hypothetical protein
MDVLVAAEVVSRLRNWSAGFQPACFGKITQLAGKMPALQLSETGCFNRLAQS